MYQSASEPALLCGINLLVIDRKPARWSRWFVRKQVLQVPGVWVQSQATLVPILWPDWSSTEKLELNAVLFFFFLKLKNPTNPKNPKTKTNVKWCSLQWYLASHTVWSDRYEAQTMSLCISMCCYSACLLDYLEE